MKKAVIVLFIVISILLCCTSVFADDQCTPKLSPPDTLYEGKIVIAVNPTVPPLQYVLADGTITGMRIELGNEIAKRLCLEPVWVNIQFDAMIPGLNGGRFDMVDTGMFFTSERAEILHLIPYELTGLSIIVPIDNPKNIEKVEDLAGLKVGVEASGATEALIYKINDEFKEKGLKEAEVFSFGNSAMSFAALGAGQVDAAIGNDARGILHELNGEYHQAVSGLSASPACLAGVNDNLMNAVKDVLNEMKEDGSYDELFEKYNIRKIYEWTDWSDDKGNAYQWNGEFEIY